MSEGVRGRWEGWHVVDEGRVDLVIVSTDPSEPNAVFDAGAEVIIRPAAEDARVAVEDTIEIICRFEATLEEKQGLQVDAGWALEVLVDVREALEDLRPDDAPKPNAEVIERAREWLSQGIRAADPAVDVGEQITEARILMDDLLACVEAVEEAWDPEPVEQLLEDIFDAAPDEALTLWRLKSGMISAEIGNPDEDGAATNAEPCDWWNLLTGLHDALTKPPAPDFDAMTPNDLRAWLDERGYRHTFRNGDGWHAALYRDPNYRDCIAQTLGRVMCICSTEPAALRALARMVWEGEQP